MEKTVEPRDVTFESVMQKPDPLGQPVEERGPQEPLKAIPLSEKTEEAFSQFITFLKLEDLKRNEEHLRMLIPYIEMSYGDARNGKYTFRIKFRKAQKKVWLAFLAEKFRPYIIETDIIKTLSTLEDDDDLVPPSTLIELSPELSFLHEKSNYLPTEEQDGKTYSVTIPHPYLHILMVDKEKRGFLTDFFGYLEKRGSFAALEPYDTPRPIREIPRALGISLSDLLEYGKTLGESNLLPYYEEIKDLPNITA